MLLDLEKEVITFAAQLGFQFQPEVGVHQLRAIEINPYAYELAQVTVQIGYLQWLRENGFALDRSPVLQVLDGFHNEDALLVPHYRSKTKTLKEAQAGEHAEDTALKFYTEREWPKCDVIVSNPPFLGGKMLRRELGDAYIDALFGNFGDRVPPEADLCCYWFEKARQQIESNKCKRAGLLATQGIRGGANREVLKRIKETGDIFFAESDRDWILAGATVHVSMVGFDDGSEKTRCLNGKSVSTVNANLTSANADITRAQPLNQNARVGFMGTTKQGPFDISEPLALQWLTQPNPNARPNSDVLVPWVNGVAITKRNVPMWVVDCFNLAEHQAARHEMPFAYVVEHVKKAREVKPREWVERMVATLCPKTGDAHRSRAAFSLPCDGESLQTPIVHVADHANKPGLPTHRFRPRRRLLLRHPALSVSRSLGAGNGNSVTRKGIRLSLHADNLL